MDSLYNLTYKVKFLELIKITNGTESEVKYERERKRK